VTATVRRATVPDLAHLRAFFCALQEEQQATHPVTYPQVSPDDPDAFVLSMFRALERPSVMIAVAEADGEPVGFLAGEVLEREIGLPRKFGHAHYLYVVPSRRKSGVAAALIAYAVGWGQGQGATFAECYGLAGDDAWARRGFKPLLTRYYLPLETVAAQSVHRDQPTPAPAPVRAAPARRGKKKRQRMNGAILTEHDAAR
jgi:GNAT superfamily N-acetyltransferase